MEDAGVLWPSHTVVVSLGQDLIATILLLMTVSSVGFHSGTQRGNIWVAEEGPGCLTVLDARIDGENPGAKIIGGSVTGNTLCFQGEQFPAGLRYDIQDYSQNSRYCGVLFPVLRNCSIRSGFMNRHNMHGSRDSMDFRVFGGWHRGCGFLR